MSLLELKEEILDMYENFDKIDEIMERIKWSKEVEKEIETWLF